MKVLLIVPIMDDLPFISTEAFIHKKTDVYPHIGLAYIASVAEKYGHEVKIMDNRFHSLEEIKSEIKIFNPDVVGISATCYTIKTSIKIADMVKAFNPNITVVVGGPIVDIYPNEVLSHDSIDIICLGESDYIFSEMLNALEKNKNLKKVKGIAFKRNKKIVFSPQASIITDVDKIPFPDRNLLENDKYYCALTKNIPVTTLISGRGCPFRCTYCLKYPSFRQNFRPRSPKNVVDEMEECENQGFKEIFFFDDTFSANIKRAKDICKQIINRKIDIVWDIRTRVDCVDKELLTLLKKANCARIHYGVESGDTYVLKTLEKGINLEKVKKTFKETKNVGITTLAFFMLGVPQDTIETINRTIKFSIELDPDYVTFAPFMNFPHTRTYEYALEKGIIKNDIWKDYALGKTKKMSLKDIYLLENVDAKTLSTMTSNAIRNFYWRPKKIINILKNIRSVDEFFRKASISLSILKSG